MVDTRRPGIRGEEEVEDQYQGNPDETSSADAVPFDSEGLTPRMRERFHDALKDRDVEIGEYYDALDWDQLPVNKVLEVETDSNSTYRFLISYALVGSKTPRLIYLDGPPALMGASGHIENPSDYFAEQGQMKKGEQLQFSGNQTGVLKNMRVLDFEREVLGLSDVQTWEDFHHYLSSFEFDPSKSEEGSIQDYEEMTKRLTKRMRDILSEKIENDGYIDYRYMNAVAKNISTDLSLGFSLLFPQARCPDFIGALRTQEDPLKWVTE